MSEVTPENKALIKLWSGITDDQKIIMICRAAYAIHPLFPVWGIDLIPNKVKENNVERTTLKAYINARGAEWLVKQHIPRVMKVQSECAVDALEHPLGYARYRSRVVFADGSEFIAEGSAQPSAGQARWQVNEMAETRSKRRVMLLATASMLVNRGIDVEDDGSIPVIGDSDNGNT